MFAPSVIFFWVISAHAWLVAALHAITQERGESSDQKLERHTNVMRASHYTANTSDISASINKKNTPEMGFFNLGFLLSLPLVKLLSNFQQNTRMWEKSMVFAFTLNAANVHKWGHIWAYHENDVKFHFWQ